MLEKRNFSAAGRNLSYLQQTASDSPLLFLHGVLRKGRDFLPLWPNLAARWEVYALDFRGHGDSDRTPGAYFVRDYVADALIMLDEVICQPVVLYGHSLGAMVAAAVAAERPGLVRAVVLEDPPFETVGPGLPATPLGRQFAGIRTLLGEQWDTVGLARAPAEINLADPASGVKQRLGSLRDAVSLRFMAECLRQVDPEVLDPLVAGRWLEGFDYRARLVGIACPTLVLQADGACGGMLTADGAQWLEDHLADCTRIALPGVGHLVHWMATEATLRYVVGFLESLG